jgi:hypothetical protein
LPFAGLADTGLAKIEKAVPPEKLRDLRRFLDCLHIRQVSPQQDLSEMRPMDPAVLPACETAFLERRCLSFAFVVSGGLGPFTWRFPPFPHGPDRKARGHPREILSPAPRAFRQGCLPVSRSDREGDRVASCVQRRYRKKQFTKLVL